MKKRWLYLAALLCLLVASVRADATDFVEITRSDDSLYYLDIESVRERDGNIVAWFKRIPREEEILEWKKVEYVISFESFRKDDRQYKPLTYTCYYSDGTNETSSGLDAEWEEIIPGSVGEAKYDSVMRLAGY